jgi:hypothetical protein
LLKPIASSSCNPSSAIGRTTYFPAGPKKLPSDPPLLPGRSLNRKPIVWFGGWRLAAKAVVRRLKWYVRNPPN